LSIHIEQNVAVKICNAGMIVNNKDFINLVMCLLVAIASRVIGHHVQTPCVENIAQPLNSNFAFWTGNLCLDYGSCRLVWEERLLATHVWYSSCGSGRGILSAERTRCDAGSIQASESRPDAARCAEEGSHYCFVKGGKL
jgi:hypothetical protein